MVSKHFSVNDALYLPQWKRLANESDGLNDEVKTNLINLFTKMDVVVDTLGKNPKAHCTYRPEEYNTLVKGAPNSGHKFGQAIDFSMAGLDCDDARKTIILTGLLEKLDMRMEDLPGSNWVHIDTCPVKSNRFFKP